MLDHYPRIIAQNDTYVTEKKAGKNFFGPTIPFYYDLLKIVVKGSRLGKNGVYNRYEWVNSALAVFDAVENAGVKVHIEGMDNLKKFDGTAVIIGNHMSSMETMIPVAVVQPVKSVVYVIKKELIDFPFFGNIVGARYPIVVGRSNPREDLKIVIEEGSNRLSNGRSVLIFPQRTRSMIFKRDEFNSLGVKLAKKNNVPVVPMAVLTDAWSNGKKLKDFGPIDPAKPAYFSFGEPITVESKGQEEHEQVLEFISGKLKEWGREELIK